MQEHYHIDLSDAGLLDRRTGRWLQVRILGLLSIDSRLRRLVYPPKDGE